MYMYDVPQRRTEVMFFVVLHRDGTDGICTDLFCFLSIPIPNSRIFDFSLSLSLVEVWLETGLPRGFPGTLFFYFISLSFVLQRQTSMMMMMIWFVSGGARVCSRNGPEPDFSPLAASMSTSCDWLFH